MNEQLASERFFNLMKKESERLKTFQLNPPWPKDYVDIKKLAKAGFFYTFRDDQVFCAFCRGRVYKWDRDDDPMSEHAKHFTTCPFIMGGDVGNEPLGEDPFPGPKRPRPYDVCGAYQSFPLTVDTNTQQHYQSNESSNHHYQHDLSCNQEQESNFQTPINLNHTSANDDSSLECRTRLSISSNSSNASSNSLSGICKICYTNSIEIVFLPCGHSASCLSCAQRLHNCPVCRSTITTRIRTFLV